MRELRADLRAQYADGTKSIIDRADVFVRDSGSTLRARYRCGR